MGSAFCVAAVAVATGSGSEFDVDALTDTGFAGVVFGAVVVAMEAVSGVISEEGCSDCAMDC